MDIEKLMRIKEMTNRLNNVSTQILEGKDPLDVCINEKVNYNWFCELIHRQWDYRNGKIELLEKNNSLLWKERFIHDLYGDNHVPLKDFDQAFELTMQYLSPLQEKIIYMYYVESMSLRKIGNEFGVTGQTINNYKQKAIRKLQSPKISKYFLYGADNIRSLEDSNQSLNYIKKQFDTSLKKRLIFQECAKQLVNESPNTLFKEDKCNTMSSVKDKPIKNLGLSIRSINVLRRASIITLDELLSKNYNDLFKIRALGKRNLNEIISIIHNMGFYNWPYQTYEIKQNNNQTPLNQLVLSDNLIDYLEKNEINSIEKLQNLYLEDLVAFEELHVEEIAKIIIKMKEFGYRWWPLENVDNLDYK